MSLFTISLALFFFSSTVLALDNVASRKLLAPSPTTKQEAPSPSELGASAQSSGGKWIPGMPPTKLSPSERIPGIPPVKVPASSKPGNGPSPPSGATPPSDDSDSTPPAGGEAPKSSKPVVPGEADLPPAPSGVSVTADAPGVVHVLAVVLVIVSSTWPIVTVI